MTWRQYYVQMAKDLGYSEEVIQKLQDAKDLAEASKIMEAARIDEQYDN